MTRDQVQEVRAATQAGKFYPAEKEFLSKVIDDYIENAGTSFTHPPKALIVPHSGLIYSGAVAACAFAAWRKQADDVERIILIGPSHHYDFPGLALPGAAAFETPLGHLPVDDEWIDLLDGL